jgi:hypothetical protein
LCPLARFVGNLGTCEAVKRHFSQTPEKVTQCKRK